MPLMAQSLILCSDSGCKMEAAPANSRMSAHSLLEQLTAGFAALPVTLLEAKRLEELVGALRDALSDPQALPSLGQPTPTTCV